MDPFLGEIRIFAGNFAPKGWALCQGQLLPIQSNTALFSLIGTYYGGDGKTNFALPDLQGRTPLHRGQGPGLTQRSVGESGGSATVTLTTPEMPAHTHAARGVSTSTVSDPTNAYWSGRSGRGAAAYYASGSPNTLLAPQAIVPAGGSQPHNNCSPYLAINYIIALSGIYPPRP